MDYETALEVVVELRDNWHTWSDLDRGDAVVALREYGVSQRKLAKIIGCSEGLIRHIEIVGRLPHHWKQYLLEGHSTRKVVAAWRARRSQQE